jgi:predicted peroxiredoxin
MAVAAKGVAMTPASVGDDGYFFVTGDQVGLLVKKGANSFKVTVYAKLPVDKKEAIELALAKEVVAKI